MGEITVKGNDLEKMRRWVVLEREIAGGMCLPVDRVRAGVKGWP